MQANNQQPDDTDAIVRTVMRMIAGKDLQIGEEVGALQDNGSVPYQLVNVCGDESVCLNELSGELEKLRTKDLFSVNAVVDASVKEKLRRELNLQKLGVN